MDPEIVPEEVMAPIVTDAAMRAGLDPSELQLTHAAAVEFNDGSLGCPEPGMVYTQAIVPGWQVILQYGDAFLDYRATGPGAFRICEDGGEPIQ